MIARYGPRGSFWAEHPELPRRPIRNWQIWNEPNIATTSPSSRCRTPTPRLLRAAYPAMKAADPGATVVMAGLANFSWRDLSKAYRAGVKGSFDVAAVHPFSGRPSNSVKITRLNREVMDRNGDPRKPIWLTELTWSSAKGKKTPLTQNWETTEAGQAQRLTQAYRLYVRARLGAPARADLLVHVGDGRPQLQELLRLLGPADAAARRASRRQARARGVPGGGAALRLTPGLRPVRSFFATCGEHCRANVCSAGYTPLIDAAASNAIVVSGAREHNLKDISLTLPRDALVVITGLSGSGKSSLAFDTIYAEGQRRYVESLSAYARQFLGQMDKPDVDSIEGLSPAISIDQKTTSRNPRSTVGTVTEIYDYLRLLWARIGHPHCHICGKPIAGQSAEQIIDQVMELEEGTRFMVLAPLVRGRKGEYGKVLEELRAEGFSRAKIDGELRMLEDEIVLDKKFKHDISIVVDRLVMRGDLRKRLADSIETAVALADGMIEIETVPARTGDPARSRCTPRSSPAPTTGRSSPSSSRGSSRSTRRTARARAARASGSQMEIDPELVVPDPSLSIGEGALAPWAGYDVAVLRADHAGDRREVRHRPRGAVGVARRGRARPLPVRHQRRPDRGLLPQPLRAQALVRDALRGHRAQPRAPLPRDRLRSRAREDRGVHVAAAVPGVQGRAAEAGVAGGARRRHRDPRVHAR